MVGPAMDCLGNPTGAVRQLFEKAVAAGTRPEQFRSLDFGVKEMFQKALSDGGVLERIPEINSVQLDLLPAKSLVRFRGMVQDMFDPEYYIGAYKEEGADSEWQTTKYADVAEQPISAEAETQVWERRLFYCVPVPGEGAWCKPAASLTSGPAVVREKRGRDEDADVMVESTSEKPEAMEAEDVVGAESAKRLRDNTECSGSMPTGSASPGLPSGRSDVLPCLVKVYDPNEDLKLNDVCEFVGVLTFDPELTVLRSETPDPRDPFAMEGDDSPAASLPASKVPRLQCIAMRKLTSSNPNLPPPGSPAEQQAIIAMQHQVQHLRSSLIRHLAALLGEDVLAAEYLLLHMLSRVYARAEPLALGKLSLNLTSCTSADVITSHLSTLLPRLTSYPMTVEALNATAVTPKKDYETNRLVSAPLQLAEGTCLVVDETGLKPGHLTPVGVSNVQALKSLMDWQKVEYDFQYYKMEIPTDIPVLILSESKSLLLADVILPLRTTSDDRPSTVEDCQLGSWRLYLELARKLDHSIDADVSKAIEADLVAARQEDRTIDQDSFHRWLVMARLMAASFGETSLTMDRWRAIRALEHRRAERLRCQ